MTDFYGRFGMVWASGSTPAPPSDAQAQQGLSFLGQTPPAAQLHDAMFQWLDQKDNWLFGQLSSIFTSLSTPQSESTNSNLGNALISFIIGKYNGSATAGPDGSSRGYQVLPSGLIVQWGLDTTVYSTIGNQDKGTGNTNTFNFASEYPNKCFGVIAQESSAGGWNTAGSPGGPAATIYGIGGVNQVGFSLSCVGFQQSSNGQLTLKYDNDSAFFFISLGY